MEAKTYAGAALELANWRGADADAHEAKAEALRIASDHLEAVIPIVGKTDRPSLELALERLSADRERHANAAALIRGGVARASPPIVTVWQQPTTGKIHLTPNCSVARRSRYGLVTLEMQRIELRDADRCRRCFRA